MGTHVTCKRIADLNPTVLYIEDEVEHRQLVQQALEAIGYGFVGAETGMEGIAAAQETLPDLVLLDIHLPDVLGYEVVRQLRASSNPKLRDVPVIAISADTLRGAVEKALQAGCDVYMSKPIHIRELWTRVQSFLSDFK